MLAWRPHRKKQAQAPQCLSALAGRQGGEQWRTQHGRVHRKETAGYPDSTQLFLVEGFLQGFYDNC